MTNRSYVPGNHSPWAKRREELLQEMERAPYHWYSFRSGFAIAVAIVAVPVIITILIGFWNTHVFNAMTPAEHLSAAVNNYPANVNLTFRHLAAIPSNSPEASKAKAFETDIREQITATEKVNAAEQRERERDGAARASALVGLASDMKNLGYDLTVEASDAPDEIVITASDFKDTDHRIRFLAFIRGRNAPTSAICSAGFTKVRFKSSSLPFVGFNESYPLNCYK